MTHSPDIITIGIVLENIAVDAAQRVDYLDMYGSFDEWRDAQDVAEAWSWWYDQWTSIFPGVVDCPHGMSLQLCEHPVTHYREDWQ